MNLSVVVVGAGAAGLSTAWHLLDRGVSDVTVLEADYPASGSSGLSVGIIQTQHLTPLNIGLRVVAKSFFDQLDYEFGLPIVRNGYIRLGFTEAQLVEFTASAELQRDLGIA